LKDFRRWTCGTKGPPSLKVHSLSCEKKRTTWKTQSLGRGIEILRLKNNDKEGLKDTNARVSEPGPRTSTGGNGAQVGKGHASRHPLSGPLDSGNVG